MSEDTCSVPEHYRILAQELAPLRDKIRATLRERPMCSGKKLTSFVQAANILSMFDADRISSVFTSISSTILARESVSRSIIVSAVDELSCAVNSCLSTFYELSSCQFPEGYEAGKPLVIALPERFLLQLTEFMDRLLLTIEDPAAAHLEYGTTKITLNVTFNIDAEVRRFQDWIGSVKQEEPNSRVSCNKTGELFWGILGGIALSSLFFGDHNGDH
ncbi:hypothetical protein OR1_02715 [Geobacter sp. OR-1]|uniref:hypothetical protein n=1 Tax=Geobacter sp. OR-1 TaxID=1266765 RepID=UPI0005430B86|nr:hypothetical protein [Geobacter sp. OR-1]GAM10426.1 hypothetical protein OR1_02715 [Geobacter sp. OR-1]